MRKLYLILWFIIYNVIFSACMAQTMIKVCPSCPNKFPADKTTCPDCEISLKPEKSIIPEPIPDNTIIHLGHSAVLLKLAGQVLIFDYPFGSNSMADQVYPLQPQSLRNERVYIFASHRHGDHHNAGIFTWKEFIPDIKYILSSDIANYPPDCDVIRIPPGKLTQVDDILIRSYLSSDAGVAFSIYLADKHIYFSGDNGYWQYRKGQTAEDYQLEYLAAIDRSIPMDIAFQVCDQGLADKNRGYGGTAVFATMFQPGLLVPLHLRGRYDYLKGQREQVVRAGFLNQFWVINHQADRMTISDIPKSKSHKSAPTTLHQAACADDKTVTLKLIKAGQDINLTDDDKRTPLHWAAALGLIDTIRLLLDRGADTHAVDKNGWTPLHLAVHAHRLPAVRLLLKHKANPNIQDAFGLTPLNVASSNGAQHIAALLIDASADPALADRYGRTPIHAAVKIADENLIALLLSKGVDIETRTKRGETPLHLVVSERQLDITRFLINAGADVNAQTRSHRTPLHEAVLTSRLELVRLLLTHKADPNVQDRMKYSPLKLARNGKNQPIIDLLIKHGAKD